MRVIALAQRDPRIKKAVAKTFPKDEVFASFLAACLIDLAASQKVAEIFLHRLVREVGDRRRRVTVADVERCQNMQDIPAELAKLRQQFGQNFDDALVLLSLELKCHCAKNGQDYEDGMERQNAGLRNDQIVPLIRLFGICYGLLRSAV